MQSHPSRVRHSDSRYGWTTSQTLPNASSELHKPASIKWPPGAHEELTARPTQMQWHLERVAGVWWRDRRRFGGRGCGERTGGGHHTKGSQMYSLTVVQCAECVRFSSSMVQRTSSSACAALTSVYRLITDVLPTPAETPCRAIYSPGYEGDSCVERWSAKTKPEKYGVQWSMTRAGRQAGVHQSAQISQCKQRS